MTAPTGDVVRSTFLEFWPPELQRYAPKQTAIQLLPEEYAAIRRSHRTGSPGEGDFAHIVEVARRALTRSNDIKPPVFLRMGYGSWALPQWTKFETLAVSTAEQAAGILSLADRRLAEISRRYVSGYTPQLFVRSFVDFALDEELRFVVEAREVVGVSRRHNVSDDVKEASTDRLGKGWITRNILNALPRTGSFSIDAIRANDQTIIFDVTPRA